MSTDAHFTSQMPTKRVAADCILTDEAGRPLVLDSPYKTTWDIPGGIVEVDESPRQAAQREVGEEIGLDIEPGELLARVAAGFAVRSRSKLTYLENGVPSFAEQVEPA